MKGQESHDITEKEQVIKAHKKQLKMLCSVLSWSSIKLTKDGQF